MAPDVENRQEKRKRRTRAAVQDAALALFAERGYRVTTMSAIADAADVSLRTVTIHFPTKADLLFDAEPFALKSLADHFDARRSDQSALSTIREWMAATMRALGTESPATQHRAWQRRAVRARVIAADDELRALARAGYYPYEQLLATHIARDLDQSPDSLKPRLAAITVVTGLRELYLTHEAQTTSSTDPTDALLHLIDRVLSFAQAGINGPDLTAP